MLDTVARLERSMLSSWPALSVAFDGDWVIRLAKGVTKRSNSVTCLTADDTDLDNRIDRVETVFRNQGLPSIFRLSPLASPALDNVLEERGWRRFDETVVMTADLSALDLHPSDNAVHPVEIKTEPDQDWLKSCYRIDGSDRTHLETLSDMLDQLIPLAGYGRIASGSQIDALAMVVIDAELTGLFEVLTKTEKRRKGLALDLLRQMFAWSEQQGARTAWLAVVAENTPALRLYQRLGFGEVYRYHYRSND